MVDFIVIHETSAVPSEIFPRNTKRYNTHQKDDEEKKNGDSPQYYGRDRVF